MQSRKGCRRQDRDGCLTWSRRRAAWGVLGRLVGRATFRPLELLQCLELLELLERIGLLLQLLPGHAGGFGLLGRRRWCFCLHFQLGQLLLDSLGRHGGCGGTGLASHKSTGGATGQAPREAVWVFCGAVTARDVDAWWFDDARQMPVGLACGLSLAAGGACQGHRASLLLEQPRPRDQDHHPPAPLRLH